MSNGRDKFEGQMLQFQKDMDKRMNRIEEKLDRYVEKNVLISAVISGATSIIIGVVAFLSRE